MQINSCKTYLFVAVLFLVLLYAFSFGPAMGMEVVDKDGQMSPCPFSMTASICKMTFSEHISLWQSMFTATLNGNAGILAIISFILAVALTLRSLETGQNREFIAYKSYSHRHSNSTPDKLIELFSRGILNPKIYVLATL